MTLKNNPGVGQSRTGDQIAVDRDRLLDAAPEKALEIAAEHPLPVTLIQSISEEDLYRLVHAIGPDDALPILANASNRQWEYLLDMEAWQRDTLDAHQMVVWFDRLLKADSDRFTHWVTKEKSEELAFFFFRHIDLHIREYEQDPGEIGEGFFSEDQTYYIRLKPYATEFKKQQEQRDSFVTDLLKRLSIFDFTLYRDMLLHAQAILPAELEEELFRLRNIRLAERGFLPFDEAIGIYQPLTTKALMAREQKRPPEEHRRVQSYPLPTGPARKPDAANRFAAALASFHDSASLMQLEAEFASLCNCIASADQHPIRDVSALRRIVRKAGGYISIGLEKVALDSEHATAYQDETLLKRHLLADIFRVGYGCALALKWKAEKWNQASWYQHQGLSIGFWGETGMGTLGGLLLKKPLCYDPAAAESHYREFETLADVTACEAVVAQLIAFDDLFSLMEIDTRPVQGYGFLTYHNMILTMWANHYLGHASTQRTPVPITTSQMKHFHRELLQGTAPPLQINDAMRHLFLGWLADRSGLADYEIAERMAPALESLFNTIEDELGHVAVDGLDPRFINLFLFQS